MLYKYLCQPPRDLLAYSVLKKFIYKKMIIDYLTKSIPHNESKNPKSSVRNGKYVIM